MKNKELKLDFIEIGRMSDGEMMEICGGAISCSTRETCGTSGKNSCREYYDCSDMTNPNKRNYCGTKSWVISDPIDVTPLPQMPILEPYRP